METIEMKLITLKNKKLYVSTNIISKKCDVEHRSILSLIKTHKKDIEDFGKLLEDKEKIPKGRPLNIFLLNEEQFTFVITLMQNSKVTVKAKKLITKQFYQMKNWILENEIQKQNTEYLNVRKQSKLERKKETDIIDIFVEYAKKQGSKSADTYFCNITKMENSAFFIIKEEFKNVREILNITQLAKIMYADIVVRQALIEGMENKMHYKDIYQLAKKRVIKTAESLPKEIIPGLEFKQISFNDLTD